MHEHIFKYHRSAGKIKTTNAQTLKQKLHEYRNYEIAEKKILNIFVFFEILECRNDKLQK